MGDYLSNLAAKALGVAPVAQPRPASLFEPPRATGRLPWGAGRMGADASRAHTESEASALEFEQGEEADGPRRQNAIARLAVPPPASMPGEAAWPPLDTGQAGATGLTIASESGPPQAFPVPAAVQDEPAPGPRDPGPRTRVPGPKGVFRFDSGSLLVPAPLTQGREGVWTEGVVAPASAAPARDEIGGPESDRLTSEHAARIPRTGHRLLGQATRFETRAQAATRASGPADSAMVTPRRLVVPRVVPNGERAAGVNLQAAAPPKGMLDPDREGGSRGELGYRGQTAEAAPVIHVTIGRIEVRAIQPAPAPPAPRVSPPAPQMSLEEYLRGASVGKPGPRRGSRG